MAFNEKPPILSGSEQQQINALRDYLFRLASSLSTATNAPVAAAPSKTIIVSGGGGGSAEGGEENEEDYAELIRQNAEELKSLITKQADEIYKVIDDKEGAYNSKYLAQSAAFGKFRQDIIGESNNYSYGLYEEISNNLFNYQSTLNGQITRGFIPDPDNNNTPVLGIAISQDLQTSAEVITDNEKNYYKIVSNNFGLYTAQGWQFWVNGRKAGWFDANKDGLLHVRKVVAEDFFQVGGKWQLKISDGGSELEFVFVG